MKKTFLGSIVGLFLIISCDKIKDLASIDFDYTNSDLKYTIPANTVDSSTIVLESSIYFNADSLIKTQSSQLSINNLKALYLKSCTVNVEAASAGQDLSAIESFVFSVSTPSATTPIEIANLPNNPNSTTSSITIPVSSTVDLSSLVKSSNVLNYKLTLKTRKKVSLETICKATLKLNIKAGL